MKINREYRAHTPRRGQLAKLSVSAVTIASLLAATLPANSAITNNATANGTPARGTYTPATDGATVDVLPAVRSLSVAKNVPSASTSAGTSGIVDTGDTITYRYVITNTSTVTLTNVAPVDTGPTFNGFAAGSTLSGFTHVPGDASNTSGVLPASVGPGQSVVFTATYTLTQLDYLQGVQVFNGVDNTASAEARDGGGAVIVLDSVSPDTVEYDLPAAPNLQITKVASLIETVGDTTDDLAEVGDEITYTYTVLNTGNVAMSNVTISDDHETGDPGAVIFLSTAGPSGTGIAEWDVAEDTGVMPTLGVNSDGPAADGDFDSLAVGGQAIFTYRHIVTQAEFDAQ